MHGLVGLNKNIILSITLIIIFFSPYSACSEEYRQLPIGNGYILTIVTPTIQTISFYSQEYKGKMRLIRGKIELIAISDEVVTGYLSIRFFKEDELLDLAEENDKEGFFIIEKKDGHVESGLDGKSFFQKIDALQTKNDLNFLKPEQVRE